VFVTHILRGRGTTGTFVGHRVRRYGDSLSPGRGPKSSLTAENAEVAEEIRVWSCGFNPEFASRLFSALSAVKRVSPLPRAGNGIDLSDYPYQKAIRRSSLATASFLPPRMGEG
jgi:hypothetical protein